MAAWSAVVFYDGSPVTGPVPCTDWEAAGLVAPFFATWGGGTVSVGGAVTGAQVNSTVTARPDLL